MQVFFKKTKTDILNEIDSCLGGRAAEQIILGEISTGAANDIKTLCSIIKKHGALSVVDGITSLCAMEFKTDEFYLKSQIDVLKETLDLFITKYNAKEKKKQ